VCVCVCVCVCVYVCLSERAVGQSADVAGETALREEEAVDIHPDTVIDVEVRAPRRSTGRGGGVLTSRCFDQSSENKDAFTAPGWSHLLL